MPDYEFVCERCHKLFTSHMTLKEHDGRMAECPQCKQSAQVHQVISHFNVQTSRKSAMT